MSQPRLTPRRKSGFTLIELLVVIAIIAILTAILLPVFFGVREKARQGTVLDHYRQITDALERYKSDHHQYPPVLFGYATAGTPMSADAHPTGGGLFPLYINDSSVFTDPNNPVNETSAQTQSVPVNSLSGTGALVQSNQAFYSADAFDANPVLNGDGTLGGGVIRYQRVWTSFPPQPPNTAADGTRQLINPDPAAGTFITCTTYHAGSGIGQGKVLVLFSGGNTAVMDDSKFLVNGPDGGTGSPLAYTFWKVTP